jgi:hypothetical protein
MGSGLVQRLVAVVLLLALVIGLAVDFESRTDADPTYPTADAVRTDYAGHVGERVNVWAPVRAVRADGIVLSYGVELFVPTRTAGLDRGDWVQVYGTLAPDRRLEPERLAVSHRSDRTYMYVVSALAAGLSLAALARCWRLDRETWTLRPRLP